MVLGELSDAAITTIVAAAAGVIINVAGLIVGAVVIYIRLKHEGKETRENTVEEAKETRKATDEAAVKADEAATKADAAATKADAAVTKAEDSVTKATVSADRTNEELATVKEMLSDNTAKTEAVATRTEQVVRAINGVSLHDLYDEVKRLQEMLKPLEVLPEADHKVDELTKYTKDAKHALANGLNVIAQKLEVWIQERRAAEGG